MELRTGSLTIDDINSPYLEAGPPDADEAVVFVHGSPGCAQEFSRFVEEAGTFTRAIALDMPGFGQADKPSPKHFIYDVPNIGVHLAKQLEALNIHRAHLVGHDFGGAFISIAATYNPQSVGSITMINSGLMRGMRWHRLARLYRTPIAGEAFMAIANEAGFKRTLKDLPADDLDVMWRNFDRPTRRAILALYRATDMEAQAANLPQFRLLTANWPALVIFGVDDPYLPAKFAERNKESLPNATVHLIEGAGHWPHLEKPDAVSAKLIPFLREAASSTSAQQPELSRQAH
ncbi:MAG: alpha/beta hydrolase [Thermoleophilaceae bacterium]|nr:alpha/beta hydrolase [Thermoleophilaceae bacterium]